MSVINPDAKKISDGSRTIPRYLPVFFILHQNVIKRKNLKSIDYKVLRDSAIRGSIAELKYPA